MNEGKPRELILAYIASHTTLTLATAQDGIPWAASLFYANDDFTLYFLSEPGTRHAQYLAANARVAATIYEDYRNWREIKGIQLEGTCEEITDPIGTARAMMIYGKKFPFIGEFLRAPQELGQALSKAKWYRIKPKWVRLVDNSRGFGWKQVVELDQGKC
jgi:uncharacterized protein YhbP (UPF0306 family)